MPKRKILDIEKETEKMIKTGSFDPHFKWIILHVDSMVKDITWFNKGSSISTRRLAVKLSKLEAYWKEIRKVILNVRKDRESKRNLIKRVNNAKSTKIK